jgi:hypothetical protein
VPERVQGHVAKRGVLQRPLMPLPRDRGAIEGEINAGAGPASVAALEIADRQHEEKGARVVGRRQLAPSGDLVAKQPRQARTNLDRAKPI